MNFRELGLPGAWLIEHGVFGDSRGQLERIFDSTSFESHGIATEVEHSLISRNPAVGTLRGFHFQVQPFVEAKTITCLAGSMFDVVVDLRLDSPTYCQWVSVELDHQSQTSLHVPRGCANAWITTSPDTNLHYSMGTAFSAEHGRGFRFDDPAFAVNWPTEPAVIGPRDVSWQPFDRQRDGIRL